MRELPNVTVIIADTKNYAQAIYAIKKTQEQIKPAAFIWFTDRIDLKIDGVSIVYVNPFSDKADYSRFIIKTIAPFIHTTHCLVIQHDGYVINGDAWDDTWLDYDYIGAPWLYPDPDRNVGNGGFSLRSKRLQDVLREDDAVDMIEPEDEIIGRLYRRYLEQGYEIKFAPESVAHKFSYELHEPYGPTFGFHGNFHPPFKPILVINRTGAMGDVIQVEPVLEYYHKKGYRVVLKTLPEFYQLFAAHYFKVEYFGTLNQALGYTYIDLDMAYEVKPKQLHLKSYYEMCGIEDGELRNAKLNFSATPDIKLFKQKYVVMHIDNREQPGRNVRGIKWHEIADLFHEKGYLVVQIGKNDSLKVPGAIQLNTIEIGMLTYVISGCDLFIGVDSGPSHIAVATGRKSIIYFGNVNPEYIHPTPIKEGQTYLMYKEVCDKPACWHEVIGTTGTDCYIDKEKPPCTKHSTDGLLSAINYMLP